MLSQCYFATICYNQQGKYHNEYWLSKYKQDKILYICWHISKTHISKTWHDVLNMDRNKKEEKFGFHNQLRIWFISIMQ